MFDVSVVIISYNTANLLDACLTSVFSGLTDNRTPGSSQPALSVEVIVVDNGSTDGSPNVVRSRFPQVRLIANEDNRGFAAANNQAIQVSSGRHVLLLNPDTVVLGDAVAKLAAFLDASPSAAVAGAQLRNPDGTHQHSAFKFPGLLQTFFDFFPVNHRLTNSRFNGRYPVSRDCNPFAIDHPLGACMMVRREAIDDVGLLDEGFFIYCEEIDWCMRMKRKGWRIFCVPEAKVTHYGGQSTRLLKGAMYAELFKSRARLFSKHFSPSFRFVAGWVIRLGLRRERRRARSKFRAGFLSDGQLKEELEALERARAIVSKYA